MLVPYICRILFVEQEKKIFEMTWYRNLSVYLHFPAIYPKYSTIFTPDFYYGRPYPIYPWETDKLDSNFSKNFIFVKFGKNVKKLG